MARRKKQGVLTATAGTGRHRIEAAALRVGNDICIAVWGGSRPHIGSVAVAVPRPSLKNPDTRSATSSVFNFTGHKDEPVARTIAERVAARCNMAAVVTAGIHLDCMTRGDLHAILRHVATLTERLLQQLEGTHA